MYVKCNVNYGRPLRKIAVGNNVINHQKGNYINFVIFIVLVVCFHVDSLLTFLPKSLFGDCEIFA